MCMAERIKKRRTAMGYTQQELANKLGLQKSAIAKYENGRVENIKRSVIKEMSRILECSPSYLLGWDVNIESSGAFVAKMLMDAEFTNYAKILFELPKEKRTKVYGYIDALKIDGK